MGLVSNQPIKPISSTRSLNSRNKANQFNSLGVSSMFRTSGLRTGSLNRIKSRKLRTNNGLNSKELFKF